MEVTVAAHERFLANMRRYSAELGAKQDPVARDTHWGRKGPVPQCWAYYDSPRRELPQPSGGEAGPAYAGGGKLDAPWEKSLEDNTLGYIIGAAQRCDVDLRHVFLQYAKGKETMLALNFYEFAYDSMLLQDSANAGGFFEMALQRSYKPTLRFGFDRFMAALARIVENLCMTQDTTPSEAANVMVEFHIAPTVASGRESWYWTGPQGSGAPGRTCPPRPIMGRPCSGITSSGLHPPREMGMKAIGAR